MVSVVIHTNMGLANQVETAHWLKSGFDAHGLDCAITPDRHQAADIHVVQGPWYCFNDWMGKPNVLWLNRCFYGDSRFDLSLGWLLPDGTRDFRNHGMASPKGTVPALKPKRDSRCHAVVFADYGVDVRDWAADALERFASVHIRPHPAEQRSVVPLTDIWARHDVAIGGSSTVLVEAEIEGLHVESHDPHHVCQGIEDRQQWLTDLSWAQWSSEELCRGDFWEHLC